MSLPGTACPPGSCLRRGRLPQAAERGRLAMRAWRLPRPPPLGSGCWAGSPGRGGAGEPPLPALAARLPQQLLRLLTLRRGTLVPKDVIAEALWPERRPADAGGNIEVLVSRIRRALGDRTLIQTGSGGYTLTSDGRCWVDAEAFLAAVDGGRTLLAERPAEALVSFRSALEICQGEPLAEDTYVEWAQEDRRHLGLALLEALEGAAAAALRS